MSKLRSLNTCFWSDPFIENLNPEAKLLFIYLITNEKTNMLGIYESSIRKMSFETNIKEENIKTYLNEFQELGKVKYFDNYVILINYMKHQNYNTNMKKSAIDTYNNLPKELKINNIKVDKDKPLEGFETLLNHYGMVRKLEIEYEYEIEDEVKDESSTEKSENFSGVEKYKWVTFDIEVQNTFYEILNFFPEHLRPITKTEEKKWLETIDKLHRIDKIPYEIIIKIVKLVRSDDFWCKNFLSLTKLRKKNPDGVKYIVVFSEKFLKNGKKEQQGGSSELRQRVAKGLGII